MDFTDCDVALRDGRAVHLRSIRGSDEEEILRAFDRLSPEARYLRFMRHVREVNVERLRAALASFPGRGNGIVATVPANDGIEIVGSCIFVVGSEPSTCEFGIAIADAYGGAGLGHALMTALIETASRRGFKEMEGFVLSVNKPMLGLATRLGFSIAADPEDWTVRICRLSLGDA